MSRFAATVSVFLVSLSLCYAQEAQLIGALPTHFHGVSGNLWAVDYSNFCIREFFYDGLGPDAFLYFYYPGDELSDTGGGVYVPVSPTRDQFEHRRAYRNETFCFTLPDAYRGCDFEGFGIWCRYANQLFTTIKWNTTDIYSLTDMANRVTCNPSPGRGYVGELHSMQHSTGGNLYIRDNKTFVIRNFTYDGRAPDVFVYVYQHGVEVTRLGGGDIIPLATTNGGTANGNFINNRAYTGLPMADLVIPIPDNMDLYTCDVNAFSIWCRQFQAIFAKIIIDPEIFTNNKLESDYETNRLLCNRPSTRPGVYVGELPTDDPRAISGSFFVQDEYNFFIQLFSYDASRENVFIFVFKNGVAVTDDGEDGIKVPISDTEVGFGSGLGSSSYNQDFTVDLRRIEGKTVRTCEVGYFAIIETTPNQEERLTKIIIPSNIFSEKDKEGKITCDDADGGSMGLLSSTLSLCVALLLATVFKA